MREVMQILHHLRSMNQTAEPVLGHPFGSREMARIHAHGAVRIFAGIEAEDNGHGFLPTCATGFRVEQAQIRFQVLTIIGRKRRALRWFILKVQPCHRNPER